MLPTPIISISTWAALKLVNSLVLVVVAVAAIAVFGDFLDLAFAAADPQGSFGIGSYFILVAIMTFCDVDAASQSEEGNGNAADEVRFFHYSLFELVNPLYP